MTSVVIDQETAIFSCDCHEKSGLVTREVFPMALSPQNLQKFWDHAKNFRILFWDHIGGDEKKFAEMLMSQHGDQVEANGLFWRIDDFVGVFYMTHIGVYDAQIHYTFFDRRHWGRQQITRKMIQFVFRKYGFRRLSAEIPCFANGTFEFIKQVGLRQEGRKRKAAFLDNEWFDVNCYGVLREEAESWG